MSLRYPTNAVLRGLLANLPRESGLSDAQILNSIASKIPHKTLARMRNAPPRSLSRDQLLFLAKFAQAHAGLDAWEILACARDCRRATARTVLLSMATVIAGAKEQQHALELCDRLVGSAKRVYLFDRADSFTYLQPKPYGFASYGVPSADATASAAIEVVVTQRSLSERKKVYGDEGVETLIDCAGTDQHQLSVLDEDGVHYARAHSGIFHDSKAVVIIDEQSLFVLPSHARSLRFYTSERSEAHLRLITDALRQYRRLQQLCRDDSIAMLKGELSYRRR